jgi:uncharacterized protein YjbI with pentapeptide repeats
MANPEHLAILKQGVEQWNKWREGHRKVRPDLAEAKIPEANLYMANFSGSDLQKANLSGADLSRADLSRAHLRLTDLTGADLRGAHLSGADLSGAHLRAANLRGARLTWADLRRADLREANVRKADLRAADLKHAAFAQAEAGGTHFADIDLSVATGLETIVHYTASTIGIDTVFKSHGRIPDRFLRGCGVPDEFIAYIALMVGRPIEFYSCFISYSTKDQEFADTLYADLQNKGVRCWFAPHDIKGGHKIHEQIDDAIRLHDKLLLILSEHSMNSAWVETEIGNAREREAREKKQMLFPITLVPYEEVKKWKLFDADRGTDSAKEIREYFIPDFSNWKDHDSYQTAFQRLLKDLKAGASD